MRGFGHVHPNTLIELTPVTEDAHVRIKNETPDQ